MGFLFWEHCLSSLVHVFSSQQLIIGFFSSILNNHEKMNGMHQWRSWGNEQVFLHCFLCRRSSADLVHMGKCFPFTQLHYRRQQFQKMKLFAFIVEKGYWLCGALIQSRYYSATHIRIVFDSDRNLVTYMCCFQSSSSVFILLYCTNWYLRSYSSWLSYWLIK